jgi:hypothetical protein
MLKTSKVCFNQYYSIHKQVIIIKKVDKAGVTGAKDEPYAFYMQWIL